MTRPMQPDTPKEPMVPYDGEDARPVGKRQQYTAMVRQLVAEAGDLVRSELAQPEVARSWCESLKVGIAARDRTAMNLYPQVMKLVGEERRVVVEFVQGLGVRNEDELRSLLSMAKSVEGVGPHDGAERCVAYLEAYFNAFPEQRPPALKRLGGYVPV